jgi:hypothetical protein
VQTLTIDCTATGLFAPINNLPIFMALVLRLFIIIQKGNAPVFP